MGGTSINAQPDSCFWTSFALSAFSCIFTSRLAVQSQYKDRTANERGMVFDLTRMYSDSLQSITGDSHDVHSYVVSTLTLPIGSTRCTSHLIAIASVTKNAQDHRILVYEV